MINGIGYQSMQTNYSNLKTQEKYKKASNNVSANQTISNKATSAEDKLSSKAKAYLENIAKNDKKHYEQQYSVAKCLKCGLCLEVCPNYHPGAEFYGAILANETYLLVSQSDKKPQVLNEYKKHFGAGCSKALSCQKVCPAGIETLTSIMRMNRK